MRFCSKAGNLSGGEVVVVNGTDPTLGDFTAIQRTWVAGACTAMTTSIRQYQRHGIEFVTRISTQGANDTATERGQKPVISGNKPVTEFPSLFLPKPCKRLAR